MAKSLPTQIEDLQRAIEAKTAEPQIVRIRPVLVRSREEVEALRRLPPVTPPGGTGPVRVIATRPISAEAYILERSGGSPQDTLDTEG